ncbi:MAG TPA: hypothetical protein VFE03_00355 [Caulobacteraceae bacterium]|jgi:hypothetical protein|nr:hypothetical protein [Caulobacteraceae bacterium]
MSLVALRMPAFGRPSPGNRSVWRQVARGAALAGGGVLVAVGAVGSVLPGHLGAPVLVAGLIVVLRTSRPARRQFIGLQRRHPKIVFPIRRLLRREPEVFPVAWQQVLRVERMVVPRNLRFAGKTRRRLARRKGR